MEHIFINKFLILKKCLKTYLWKSFISSSVSSMNILK
jgi:hypothetical protein